MAQGALWQRPHASLAARVGPDDPARRQCPRHSAQLGGIPVADRRVGQPHIVEVEYPSDVPQTIGLSIVDPNAAGAVVPMGLDSGVYVPDEAAADKPRLAVHRLVFWPRTKNPLLLITNRREGTPAVYGKIRVLAGRATCPRRLKWPTEMSSG